MTNAEMNRRLATIPASRLEHIKRMAWYCSYTPYELSNMCRIKLASINAVFKLVKMEKSK